MQGSPFSPVYPDRQEQWVCSALPAGDVEPAGQLEQASLPTVDLKVPAAHKMHDSASAPVVPAGHPKGTLHGVLEREIIESAVDSTLNWNCIEDE